MATDGSPETAAESSTVLLYGTPYKVDLRRVRERMVEVMTAGVSAGEKVTVADIAKRIGVSRFTFYRLLNGDSVSLSTLRLVSAGLGMQFEEVAKPASAAA